MHTVAFYFIYTYLLGWKRKKKVFFCVNKLHLYLYIVPCFNYLEVARQSLFVVTEQLPKLRAKAYYSRTPITRPRITWQPAFYNEFTRAWQTSHGENVLKFRIMGCVIIRHPASTDTLLRARTYMTAEICREPNNAWELWHPLPPIRGPKKAVY